MSIIGYARVSTTDQSLEIQEQQLREAGAEKIFTEQKSGKSTVDRARLADCLDYVREGDVLVVTRMDRLARSVVDLRTIIHRLQSKGVGFRCIHQPIDTTSPEGRLMLTMLGAFAEFELEIRKERQREGIEKARVAGAYKGGKARCSSEKVAAVLAEGVSVSEAARRLGVSRMTVRRHMPQQA